MSRNSLKSVCRLIQSIKEEIPIEKQFVEDLKRSIELNDKKESRKPSQTYKPSSMNCLRNMYYQRIGVEPESESNAVLIGICESGTDRHERVQEAVSRMKENNIDCEYIDVAEYIKQRELTDLEIVSKQGYETKLFHKKLCMSFLCDGIIKYKGKYYILEIKTESINKWYNRTDVAEEHKNQATAYSYSFNIDNVIFLYINRDMCDMKPFMFTVTPENKRNLVGRINECEECVKVSIPPKKDENTPKKACNYCNYKKQCQKDG